jgi:DNA-directed RNA polymerase specialized sigma24 family protein
MSDKRGTRPSQHDGLSQTEIAKRLGISHTRVQQIERRALEKLRRALERRGIEREDLP